MFSRCDIINYFIKTRGYKTYLEIGVEKGLLISNVNCEIKIGVDPNPLCSQEIYEKHIVKATSDEFFKLLDENEKFDIIFIDGDHHYQQIIKDIHNSLKHLSSNGIILLHDMYCSNEYFTNPVNLLFNSKYIGDGYAAFIQMVMLNEIDHKYNIYFTCVDGVGAIDTQNTLEIFKINNILDRYIDLIEEQLELFGNNNFDRNNNNTLRTLISAFTLDYITYKQNITWLYPVCNIAKIESELEHSNVYPQITDMDEIKNAYFK